jgi:translation initiation factor IF-3
MPPFEALKMARGQGLDLVEVSPTANPPVCRIINYGKYLYQQSKRQHEARKHQKSIELKEVKFRPQTSEHDFGVKRNHILDFLKEGDKVKATIMFKGRQMAHRELGWNMMQRLISEVGEVALVESRPKQEGPNLTAVLAPKKTGGKGVSQKQHAPTPAAHGQQSAATQSQATHGARSAPGASKPAAATESSGG